MTFVGPEQDDLETLAKLPPELAELLRTNRGFILYGGALLASAFSSSCETALCSCSTPSWATFSRSIST
jgi:hypothetical protein